jgi:hypothetical protein
MGSTLPTVKDIMNMHEYLEFMLKHVAMETRLRYVFLKIMDIITPEVNVIKSLNVRSRGFEEFDNLRTRLCDLYADKGINGSAMIVAGEYIITKNKGSFDAEMGILSTEFKKEIDEYTQMREQLDEILAQGFTTPLPQANIEWLPAGVDNDMIHFLCYILKWDYKQHPVFGNVENICL